jgi:hypothetical protein
MTTHQPKASSISTDTKLNQARPQNKHIKKARVSPSDPPYPPCSNWNPYRKYMEISNIYIYIYYSDSMWFYVILCDSMWFLDNSTSPDVSRCIPDNLVWIATWDLNLRLRLGRGHPGICPSDRSKSTRPRVVFESPHTWLPFTPKQGMKRHEIIWNPRDTISFGFKMND